MKHQKSTPGADAPINRALLRAQIEGDAWADAASAALGVNRTDFSCLRALFLEGGCTAGRLAEITGLTTGAVTGVLDRLERASFVRRGADPDDRRKVVVSVSPERALALEAIVFAVAAGPATAEVERFLDERAVALRRETDRLRASQLAAALPVSAHGTIAIPRRDLREARLEIVGGAMELAVRAEPLPGTLLRAELGEKLKVAERGGHVRISHRGLTRSHPKGFVSIASEVAWAVRVSGGSNRLAFDLEGAAVSSVDIEGGAGKLRFRFGDGDGVVPIRVNGGASEIVVQRPDGAGVEVVARGRISNLTADGNDLGALSAASWSSGAETPRVRLAVRSGLNRVVVARV